MSFLCRRATMERASATARSPSASSWSCGSKGSCSTSPPSTSKGWREQEAASTKSHLYGALEVQTGKKIQSCPQFRSLWPQINHCGHELLICGNKIINFSKLWLQKWLQLTCGHNYHYFFFSVAPPGFLTPAHTQRSCLFSPTASLLCAAPQETGRSAQPGPGNTPSFPDLQRRGEDRYQQDWGVPGGNTLSSKVSRLEVFMTHSFEYQIICLTPGTQLFGWI